MVADWRHLSLLVAVVGTGSLAPVPVSDLLTMRAAELQQLSVCPSRPSVGVIGGDVAPLLISRLHAVAGTNLDIVERARLSEVTAEQCLGPGFDPASAPPSAGLLFAMYLIDVQASLTVTPTPVSVRMIRVDSGAVIFQRSEALVSPTMDTLTTFINSTVPGLIAAIGAHPAQCRNTFAAVIAEDVTLSCAGAIDDTPTRYTVDTTFTVEFAMTGFDYGARGVTQALTGTARIVPATARTTLADTVTRTNSRCAFTLSNEREISTALDGHAIPATFALTVPADPAGEWIFTPTLGTTPALFRGAATMVTTMRTEPAATCGAPGGTTTRTTTYTQQELNRFSFGTQRIRPVCTGGHTLPVAMTRVPNLGAPGAADITPGCSVRSGRARFSFRRQP